MLLLLLLLRLLLHLSCRCFLRAPALGGDQSRRVVREGGPVGGGRPPAPAALSVFAAIVPVGGAARCPAPRRHGYKAARLKLISQIQVLLGGGEADEGVQGEGEGGSAVHCAPALNCVLLTCTPQCATHLSEQVDLPAQGGNLLLLGVVLHHGPVLDILGTRRVAQRRQRLLDMQRAAHCNASGGSEQLIGQLDPKSSSPTAHTFIFTRVIAHIQSW